MRALVMTSVVLRRVRNCRRIIIITIIDGETLMAVGIWFQIWKSAEDVQNRFLPREREGETG